MSPRLWPNDEGPPTRSQSEGQRHAFTNQEMESRPDALHPTAVFTPWWASSGHEPPFRAPGAPGHAQGPPEPSEASRAVIEGVVVRDSWPGLRWLPHEGAENDCPCCLENGYRRDIESCLCPTECEDCLLDDDTDEASDEDEEGDWLW